MSPPPVECLLFDQPVDQRVSYLAVFLPALFGLLGAVVGGGATYLASIRQTEAATRRQEAREAAEVRGIARLLISEYDDAQLYLSSTLDAQATLPLDADIRVDLPRDDALQLASRMTAEEWARMNRTNGDIKKAESLIAAFNTDNGRRRSEGGVGFRRGRAAREIPPLIDSVGRQIDDGRVALSRVAGMRVRRE